MIENMAEQLKRLEVCYGPGEVIIREGDASTDVFVLMKGAAEVIIDGHVLHRLDVDEGDLFFGELATILKRPRTATVSAATACTILRIPGESLFDVLARCPRLLGVMLHQMAVRTIAVNKSLSEQSLVIPP